MSYKLKLCDKCAEQFLGSNFQLSRFWEQKYHFFNDIVPNLIYSLKKKTFLKIFYQKIDQPSWVYSFL